MNKGKMYKFWAVFKEGTLEEILVRFLKRKNAQITERDKIFLAAIAYWLPFAMRDEPNCSPIELKQYALTSVYRLQQHINYLIQSFALDESALIGVPVRIPTGDREPQTSLESKIADSDKSSAIVTQPSDFLHSSDDEIFEQMFS